MLALLFLCGRAGDKKAFTELVRGLREGVAEVPGEKRATDGMLCDCSSGGCWMELPMILKHSTASSEVRERFPLSLKKEASMSLVC